MGETGPEAILELIDEAALRRTTLTSVGVGMSGNYSDAMMEMLSNRGATAHTTTSAGDLESENHFKQNLHILFHEVPRDARIQVVFNPDAVRKYPPAGALKTAVWPIPTSAKNSLDFGEMGFRGDVTAPLRNPPPAECGCEHLAGDGLFALPRHGRRDCGN